MTVLQQMARIDPMSGLMSPSIGTGMQAQMEAKLAGLRSPNASARQSFGTPNNRDSFSGDNGESYLYPDSANGRKSSGSKASNRTSAPGLLNAVTPSWGGNLDQVLERGPSPSAESNVSGRSGNESRPKSTDFSGHANIAPGSASFPKSPQVPGSRADDLGSLPLSPNVTTGNWASMVNTPAVPMFGHVNTSNLSGINDHPAFSVPKLAEAPKRRTSGKMGPAGLSSPGSLGGGFQGASGTWSAQRSPAPGGNDQGFPNFGLGVGMGSAGGASAGFNGIGSPSPSDLALQMSQLQLQQLQIQQLQQLQQLGVAGAAGGLGMGLPGMGLGMGLGMGMPGLPGGPAFNGVLGGGQGGSGASRNASGRSLGSQASNRRSPMLGSSGNGGKSPSPAGRRESGPGAAAGADEEVDIRVLEDVSQWLRTLRLHVTLFRPFLSIAHRSNVD